MESSLIPTNPNNDVVLSEAEWQQTFFGLFPQDSQEEESKVSTTSVSNDETKLDSQSTKKRSVISVTKEGRKKKKEWSTSELTENEKQVLDLVTRMGEVINDLEGAVTFARSFTEKMSSDVPKTVLKFWFFANLSSPYPKKQIKEQLAQVTGLESKQVENWLSNTRKRYLLPIQNGTRIPNSAVDLVIQDKLLGTS